MAAKVDRGRTLVIEEFFVSTPSKIDGSMAKRDVL
jgi:hypothetical protein